MIRTSAFLTPLALSLLLLLSCNSHTRKAKDEKAKLNKEQMIAVLIDIHLTEAALRIKPVKTQQNDIYSSHYYTALFKKHHTTKDEFMASMRYYKDDLETLNNIYMLVVDSLSRMQGPAPASVPVPSTTTKAL